MPALSAEQFYKDHIADEREYVNVYPAYATGRGEVVNGIFYGPDDFEQAASSALRLALPAPKRNLPADMREITPVAKGETITVRRNGLLKQVNATHDGFVITQSVMQKNFVPNFEFTSQFNYAGKKYETEETPIIVTLNGDKPLKGIVLEEETVLLVAGVTHRLPAGALLYENGKKFIEAPNTQLRLTHEWTARFVAAEKAHKIALARQAQLKEKSRKKKQGAAAS